jgi:hypothetical protein
LHTTTNILVTGKMDGFNPNARTPQEYMAGTSNFRTDLYGGPTSGHLLTHKDSIELKNGVGGAASGWPALDARTWCNSLKRLAKGV